MSCGGVDRQTHQRNSSHLYNFVSGNLAMPTTRRKQSNLYVFLLMLYNYIKFPCTYSLQILLLFHQFTNFISQFVYIYLTYMHVHYNLIYLGAVFKILQLFLFIYLNLVIIILH